ncbi:MAG: DNA polymerase IV [Candidatus Thermoplasmatota archaeon]
MHGPAQEGATQATPPQRVVFHVDMDAFYAAVEMRDDPRLRHVPVVIGADPSGGQGRGVVCTANYPARTFGIRSAMPISQAWRLAPHAVFIRPDFSKYGPASDAVMQVLERYADVLEVVGMDEAYLDMTAKCATPDGQLDWDLARSLARSLQAAVARETGLSCSVGVAPSKAVAKIATDRRKPHGVTPVRPDEVRAFLDPLAVRCISGCGPKTAAALNEDGIRTIADLAGTSPDELERRFGSHGRWLHQLALGLDARPVVSDHGPRKSRGNETTFLRDAARADEVLRVAGDLLEETLDVHDRRDRRAFTTLTVKVRYADYTTLTRAHSVDVPFEMDRSDTPARAWAVAKALLGPLLDGRAVRLVGVRLTNFLEPTGQRPLSVYGFGVAEPVVRPRHRAEKPWGAFDPGGLRQLLLA